MGIPTAMAGRDAISFFEAMKDNVRELFIGKCIYIRDFNYLSFFWINKTLSNQLINYLLTGYPVRTEKY